ncbi:RAMP superfamily CRISPR-associated protein [Streptomyces sp. NPDC051041]|uniref:RAMP superfamily CRISPR-associated protein n=1 Tax=Streptomyces sp. NPDC051041 TaxID=3365640 RepID=UPI0037B0B255
MTTALARATVRRLRVRGWLKTLSPLHVGGAGHDPNGALPVATDGRGRLYVPGTSLAGPLRALSRPGRSTSETDTLWGFSEPGTRNAAVSRFVVHDALICSGTDLDDAGEPAAPLDPSRLEIRYSVGIDRHRGTAAHGFLHARSVVPKGSHIRFELDLNSGTGDTLDDDRRQIGHLLALLTGRRLRLGAAKTRGLGRLVLLQDLTEVYEQDLTSADGLFAALERGGTRTEPLTVGRARQAEGEEGPERRKHRADASLGLLDITISWRPTAPVMVRSATDGFTIDALPLTSAVSPGRLSPVLPGSALKGVLRNHAERIERTVRRTDAPTVDPNAPAPDRSAAFRRQLAQLPVANALFGTAPDAGRTAGDEGDRSQGAGAVIVDDCYANAEIPADLWSGLHQPDDAPHSTGRTAWQTLRDEHGMERADHVAIDRWTGGAADGRLYSTLEPHGLEWEPINLTVDLARLGLRDYDGRPLGDAAKALLMLTLRDLQAGRIRLGFAVNRGMGDIHVTSITLSHPEDDRTTTLDDFLAGDRARALTDAWRSCTAEGSPA